MPTKKFVWHGDNILYETDENDEKTVEYTYNPDQYGELISERRDDVTYMHYYDALGSTVAMTDDSGDVTDTFDYDAWGNEIDRMGDTPTPFRWVGHFGYSFKIQLTVFHIRRRTYEPANATWNSADPFRERTARDNFLFDVAHPSFLLNALIIDWMTVEAYSTFDTWKRALYDLEASSSGYSSHGLQGSIYPIQGHVFDFGCGGWLLRDHLTRFFPLNLYRYAASNPLVRIDPSGQADCKDCPNHDIQCEESNSYLKPIDVACKSADDFKEVKIKDAAGNVMRSWCIRCADTKCECAERSFCGPFARKDPFFPNNPAGDNHGCACFPFT